MLWTDCICIDNLLVFTSRRDFKVVLHFYLIVFSYLKRKRLEVWSTGELLKMPWLTVAVYVCCLGPAPASLSLRQRTWRLLVTMLWKIIKGRWVIHFIRLVQFIRRLIQATSSFVSYVWLYPFSMTLCSYIYVDFSSIIFDFCFTPN